jgi:hypothetical protein
MDNCSTDEDSGRKTLRHVRIVELGKAKRRLAEFAVLFLRMGQPFHQAVLMDEFDAATAFAGIEERLFF